MESDLCSALEQTLLQVLIARAILDVPLASGHNLERLVAFFEELNGVHHRVGIPLELTRFAEHLHHRCLGAKHGLSRQLCIGLGPCWSANP